MCENEEARLERVGFLRLSSLRRRSASPDGRERSYAVRGEVSRNRHVLLRCAPGCNGRASITTSSRDEMRSKQCSAVERGRRRDRGRTHREKAGPVDTSDAAGSELKNAMHEALVELGIQLQQTCYEFVTVTPATHARVDARDEARGWRVTSGTCSAGADPFTKESVPRVVFDLLTKARALRSETYRSEVRFSTLGGRAEGERDVVHLPPARSGGVR